MPPPASTTTVNVLPGAHHVTGDPATTLITVLGPCVAACIRDPVARVGGMNHFVLANDPRIRWGHAARPDMRFGEFAMPRLILDIVARGGRMERLQAHLFGGAAILGTEIGAANADFAQRFLRAAGIPVVGRHLGADTPRRILFSPHSGRATVALPRRDPAPEPNGPSFGPR